MAIPIREDGSAGPTKHLIIFVHGFCSKPDTWKDIRTQLDGDQRLSDSYEYRSFSYNTRPFTWSFAKRLPELREMGQSLGSFIGMEFGDPGAERYIDVTLVGHSMGGLIIQSYIATCLEQNQGHELDRLRQVILFAAPSFGSPLASGFRRFASLFVENSQERALRVFSPESRLLHQPGS